MVNIAYMSLAILATAIPLAIAENCRNTYIYCGHTLLHKGNINPNSL